MNGPAWNHLRLEANGIGIHYVRQGNGSPLVLLHGWSGLISLTVRSPTTSGR
jgi:pimeloyl-ACP methyl ester carboxylesterase